MSLDPSVAMALAVHAHKGVYALLLGSGVSRAANIPTGWEVIQTLARRVAAAEAADPGGDPVGWYRTRFKKEPAYSDLVQMLAPTPPERQSLLREFFEATDAEREQGLKAPTAAHRAIAQLVAKGYVRVICTTNFDRLMERALEDAGVSPTVVSTPDQVQGMMPPQHTKCLVIKLHGDYLDTRLRNTADELQKYDAPIDALLGRVLTEYGLILCGWSADWDTALVDAIERATTHRFSTFWMAQGALTKRAEEVRGRRGAVVVPIASADTAFQTLLDRIGALEAQTLADPMSAQLAVATMKRYLAEPLVHRIRLEDTVLQETRSVVSKMNAKAMPVDPLPDRASYVRRVEYVEATLSVLVPMIAVGVKWGDASINGLWSRCIALLAREEVRSGTSYECWTSLRRYPATLVMYAAGAMALHTGRYDVLRSILMETKLRSPYNNEATPVVTNLCAHAALHYDAAQWFYESSNGSKRKTPGSERIETLLGQAIGDLFDDPTQFRHAFDHFEMLLALLNAGLGEYPPIGCFGWRREHGNTSLREFVASVEAQGGNHPIYTLGVFLDPSKFKEAVQRVGESANRVGYA